MYGDYHLLQFAIVEGLEKVVRRAVMQRVLGVLKVAVGSEYYHLGLAAGLPKPLEHLDAVHLRHAYVGYDDVGLEFQRRVVALLAVGRLAYHEAVQRRPVYRQHNAPAHIWLIFHNENFKHLFPSL